MSRGISLGAVALTLAIVSGCQGHSIVPLDTKPATDSEAADLAFSVADRARCGSFEALGQWGPRAWDFTCRKGDTSFDIVVFGSEEARDADVASYAAEGRPYVSNGFYAVVVAPSGASKADALAARPPAALLDPFR